jgi:hypothetical protein
MLAFVIGISYGESHPVVGGNVLKLRAVNKELKHLLESDISLKLKLFFNDSGGEGLTAIFLQRWHGTVLLHCTSLWRPGSRWFEEISYFLATNRVRLPRLCLSLLVGEDCVLLLAEALLLLHTRRLKREESAVYQLEIQFCGKVQRLLLAAAAPLAELGSVLSMTLSLRREIREEDESWWLAEEDLCSSLPEFLSSNIRIISFSLRLFC